METTNHLISQAWKTYTEIKQMLPEKAIEAKEAFENTKALLLECAARKK